METKQENEKLNMQTIPVTKGSRNVFADLGLPEAGELQIKAELTRQICHRIQDFGLTQTEAGRRLGLKQPDVSRLRQGKFTGFSTDRLFSLLTALDVDIEIILRPRERPVRQFGTVRVLAEVG